jgi:hypothetical protein
MLAFALLIAATVSMLFLNRKQPRSAKKGRRGLLDSRRDIEGMLNELPGHLEAVTERMDKIRHLANRTTVRITHLTTKAEPGIAAKAHRHAAIAASKFIKHANFLKVRGDVLGDNLALLNQSKGELLTWAMTSHEESQITWLSAMCKTLLPSTIGAIDGLTSFRDSTESIRWVSEQLDIAGDELRVSADRIIRTLSDSRDFYQRSLERLDG